MSQKTNTEVCPGWSVKNRSCLLSRNGLFLPMTEHVALYCEGGNYRSCTTYVSHMVEEQQQQEGLMNRRRHERIPCRYSFHLAEYMEDESLRLVDDSALTIDYSAGGMRFESSHPLNEGAIVHFTLNDDLLLEPLHGLGQVKWCRSMENRPLYQAGVAFADPAFPELFSDHIGLAAA